MNRLNTLLWLSAAVAGVGVTSGRAQSPWLSLGDFGHPTYLDTTSIVHRSPGVAVVTVRLVGYTGPGYDRVETQEINCRTHESRVLKAEDKQANERAIGGLPAARPDSVWHGFASGSLGARLLGALCAYVEGGAKGT
jgi:hypothetical protein